MKKLLVLIFIIVGVYTAQGQIKAGAGVSTYYNSFLLGGQIKLGLPLADKLNLGVSGTYFLKKKSSFAFDVDVRYQLIEIGSTSFEPLVGFNIGKVGGNGGTSMNVGVFTLIERDRLDIYLEPKLIVDNKTIFVISGGVYF